MDIIKSYDNKLIKYARSLSKNKVQSEHGAFLVEGKRFISEVTPKWEIYATICSVSFAKYNNIETYSNLHIAQDHIFNKLADTIAPQGILAIVKQNLTNAEHIINDIINKKSPFVLLLENISDPGNLGTILRSAYCSGVDGVVLSSCCTNIYAPKAVRASAGSIFHVPFVVCDLSYISDILKKHGITIYAATVSKSRSLYTADFLKPAALALGNEASGLSFEILNKADDKLYIPSLFESLNVAAAASVFVYEAYRQRNL